MTEVLEDVGDAVTETFEDIAEATNNSDREDDDDDDEKFERVDYGTAVLGGVFAGTWVANNLL